MGALVGPKVKVVTTVFADNFSLMHATGLPLRTLNESSNSMLRHRCRTRCMI